MAAEAAGGGRWHDTDDDRHWYFHWSLPSAPGRAGFETAQQDGRVTVASRRVTRDSEAIRVSGKWVALARFSARQPEWRLTQPQAMGPPEGAPLFGLEQDQNRRLR